MAVSISLPSIHEMFPDYLLRRPPGPFSVLRSDPACSSLTYITSSHTLRRRESTPVSSEDDSESGGKKHVCRTCHKRFNRPSSLRIHLNTHTGATPFRCPFPGCRRAFNVNSNMRRHYRNHSSSPERSSRLRRTAYRSAEYAWHRASPSDEERDKLGAETSGKQTFKETEEKSEEQEYVRRRISDVRTTS